MFNYPLIFLVLFVGSNLFAADKVDKLEDFFKDKSELQNPFGLRDPFKAPFSGPVTKEEGKGKGIILGNEFSNITTIGTTPLNKIKIVGTIVGENRKAIAQVEGDAKGSFFLTEGMKLGTEQAELKAILPAGVVLVEKITNVYGQEEYLETIIPISVK